MENHSALNPFIDNSIQLHPDQFYPAGSISGIIHKNTIILHHTAGSHRADWSIQGWNANPEKIGVAYCIGGLDKKGSDTDKMDGQIFQCMPDAAWAYHLGTKFANHIVLEQQSIGIEICNYGPIIKSASGQYLTYVNSEIAESEVFELDTPWRGYKFWHKYTDKQLDSAKQLILSLSKKYGIDVKKTWIADDFDICPDAVAALGGLYTHCQLRNDKFDCWPSPELITMLNSL